MANRQEVYRALDNERAYQEQRWSEEPKHSITEYLVYMQDYIAEALHELTRTATPIAEPRALHAVRKITALGVACMETHGAPERV